MKKTAELKVLPISVLKPAEYNPRKKLKPGDKEYKKIKDSEILKWMDVLVDGPFIEAEKDISLAFRGSRNQRIIPMKKGKPYGK